MPIRSNLVSLSALFLAIAFLMLSCGSRLHSDELTVHVPPHFAGTVHVDTCASDAPAAEITLNAQGLGKTSLCPAVDHTVVIEVVSADRHYRISAPEVRILRTGDGFVSSLETQIRP